MDTLTKNLSEIDHTQTNTVGGKAASLGEMLKAGFMVPQGYVITTAAFDHFLASNELNLKIQEILQNISEENPTEAITKGSAAIQELFNATEIPPEIATAITSPFAEHAMTRVAVRSSATVEDGKNAAWAGQLDTFLNVSEEALMANIKNCWASLFSVRALHYRLEQKLLHTHISVAVVIQEMIDSEKSGIAFSVHPVTKDTAQIIIEAGFGLGELIVAGEATPDSYVVQKESQDILDITVNTQDKALYSGAGETNTTLLDEKGSKQVLASENIQELATIIEKIEKHYGFPCDIEWAYANETFYITQSRPITTL
ncbi:MAG: phosphoenolpyruvate synthase/pyruvate phosphate dikinase [Candidatus Azotimanducaceae bacterium]|jgi:phosphoenolpyruvate synthase/pyruvate phosphate dikinase